MVIMVNNHGLLIWLLMIIMGLSMVIWLVVWNHGILNDFPIILGMSSSQLTNEYVSEGLKPPTRMCGSVFILQSFRITIIFFVSDEFDV